MVNKWEKSNEVTKVMKIWKCECDDSFNKTDESNKRIPSIISLIFQLQVELLGVDMYDVLGNTTNCPKFLYNGSCAVKFSLL